MRGRARRGAEAPPRRFSRRARLFLTPPRRAAPRPRALAIRSLTDLSREQDGKTTKLHGFEIAALANLVQEDTDVEEIVALVPSLSRFDQRQTQDMLDIVSRCGANAAKAAADEDADDAAAAADDAPAEEPAAVSADGGMDVEDRPPEAVPSSDAPAETL